MGIYQWQSGHGFRNGQNRNLSNLKPKYKNIKEEVLFNPYQTVSTDNWNQTLRKSKAFYESWARKKIRTRYKGYFDDKITGQHHEWDCNVSNFCILFCLFSVLYIITQIL